MITMSNHVISPLATYVDLSPNYSQRNGNKIDRITPHHMAGVLSVETCGNIFKSPARQASSNYGIGNDGRIACYVPEEYRAWTSSNAANDRRAVTIEVSNSMLNGDWPVSPTAWDALVKLCVDICKRNGIPGLVWTGTTLGSVTTHDMFANTNCPGPYLKSRMGELAETVNKALETGVTPEPTPTPEAPANADSFGGVYRCTVNSLQVRTGPGLSYPIVTDANGKKVHYDKGGEVELDDWYKIADGYVWGRYTGATSGQKRYIAVGRATGKPEADDYLIKK